MDRVIGLARFARSDLAELPQCVTAPAAQLLTLA
jgi:hypothetical protein